jgi:hypothetical protein
MDNDTSNAILFGQIRTALALIAGALAAHGVISSNTATEIIGVATALVPIIWSVWNKIHTEQKTQIREVAAVNAGVAVAQTGTVGETVRPADVPAIIKEFAPPTAPPTEEAPK